MVTYTQYTDQTYTGGFGNSAEVHLNYRLIGEWQRANYMLQRFPKIISRATNLAAREMAYKYKKQVVKNIQNQGAELGWAPITSLKYRAYKERHSPHSVDAPYQFFGTLIRSITAYKHRAMGWTAGIKKGVTNDAMTSLRGGKNTLSVAEYAAVLEHGSTKMNISARPLWTPSWRQVGGNAELTRVLVGTIRTLLPGVKLKLSPRIGRAMSYKSASL